MLLRPVSISVLNATLPSVLLSPLKFSIIVKVTLSSTLTIIFPDWLLSLPLTLIYNVWPLVSLSAFTADIGYLGAKKQNIDINLISNHIGKKTNSGIRVDGALKDEASKLFRGSIDFKNGSSGSVGAETENVLLLGEDVRNKTIPLILCAEEDVNGSHGATIGELDEETLFYYASRGIDKKNAEDIMTKGRIEVIIRKINDEDTEKLAEEQLEEVLQ